MTAIGDGDTDVITTMTAVEEAGGDGNVDEEARTCAEDRMKGEERGTWGEDQVVDRRRVGNLVRLRLD